jgi:gliding motility-associated-like protein
MMPSKHHYFVIILFLLFFSESDVKALGTATIKQVQENGLMSSPDLRFIENKNQWESNIHYRAKITPGHIDFEKDKFHFVFFEEDLHEMAHQRMLGDTLLSGHVFNLQFVNANPNVHFESQNASSNYFNYFVGDDQSKWASHVQQFLNISYINLYEGIDIQVHGEKDQLIYDYIVHAGSDVTQIKTRYDGVENLKIKNGSLFFTTSAVDVQELKPLAYQMINGERKEIPCNYLLGDDGVISYEFPKGYNHTLDLIIDPTLVFSSYTGSTADNFGFTATYDASGNLYAGGIVFDGGSYPIVGAFSSSFNGGYYDISISKFNATGTSLIYSTYLGGNGDDRPHSMFVNSNNELYVFGSTNSSNYPTISSSYDRTYNGGYDIIITRFSFSGATLLSSTYVGGTADDGMHQPVFEYRGFDLAKNYSDECRGEIFIDSLNNVYIASYTMSPDFPTTSGVIQRGLRGDMDACIFKLPANLNTLTFSTYLGGSNIDAAYSLKLDLSNDIVVCGGTMSSDMPVGGSSYDPTFNGSIDGFLYKLNSTASSILARTYIGTSSYDQTYFIDIDRYNNIYVMGQSEGSMPVVGSVYSNSGGKQFIEKFDNSLSALLIATVFGSGRAIADISPTAFLVDRCDNIYVSGWGGNVNSPTFGYAGGSTTGMTVTSDAIRSTTDGSDFYFIVFNRNAGSLLYASYFGGNASVGEHVDGGTCRFDKEGVIYEAICAGCGGNSLFPSTVGAWSRTNNSSNCNLAAMKFEFNLAGTNVEVNASPRATGCVPLTVNFTSVLTRVRTVRWIFGDGASSTLLNPSHTYTDTGTFSVMLIGTDSTSCNITDTAYLSVFVDDDSITANFTPNLVENCSTKTVSAFVVNFPTTTYSWDLGDGYTSTNDTVIHTYAAPGTYTIRLRVDDSTSCNGTQTVTRTIVIKPVVDLNFALSDTVGCFPLTITFNNTTSSLGAFLWNFDDGSTSTLKTPTHTFASGGHYDVMVTLLDSSTCNIVDTAFAAVDVLFDTVAPAMLINRVFYSCDSVGIDVTSLNPTANSIQWFFGDGSSSTLLHDFHIYRDSGLYYIDYIVIDSSKRCRMIDTLHEYVGLNPIDAKMSFSDTNGCVPLDIIFTDNSGLFLATSIWSFGDGRSDTGIVVPHLYTSVNTWTIQHIILDSSVCNFADTTYATIKTRNDSSVAIFSSVTLNQCDSNLIVQFTNRSINALRYEWNFGDGQTSDSSSPTHVWTLPGVYTVRMISIDSTRCHPYDTAYETFRLKPNAIASFNVLPTACSGVSVPFENTSNLNAQFTWLFSDGGISNAVQPSHTFDSAGIYTITLVIRDTGTCDMFDTMRTTIQILAFPIANFIMDRDSFYYLDQIQFTNLSQNFTNVLWHFGNGDTSIEENPLYQYQEIHAQHPCIIAYIVGTGCADTFCRDIYINYDAIIGVPNAFSPNGDGINDMVKVEGLGIVELEFMIFNRWGEKVFQSNDKNIGWDGVYKGVPQEMDVYAYTVKAKFLDDTRRRLNGNITLLR